MAHAPARTSALVISLPTSAPVPVRQSRSKARWSPAIAYLGTYRARRKARQEMAERQERAEARLAHLPPGDRRIAALLIAILQQAPGATHV